MNELDIRARVEIMQKEIDEMKRTVSEQTKIINQIVDLIEEQSKVLRNVRSTASDVHLGKPMKENEWR